MKLGYKYRLYPTKAQEAQLIGFCGSTRWLWNYMLDLNKKKYETDKQFVFAYDMANRLPALKKEHIWLKEIPSQALQQKCLDLDKALKAVWKSKFGFPKFKSKHKSQDSFRLPQGCVFSDTTIILPKLGAIKWKYHRELAGKATSVTISRDGKHWYASVLCEAPEQMPIGVDKNNVIAIDLGVTDFAVLSDGTKIKSPKFLKAKLRQLKKAQRQLAKKQKGSNNRRKQADRVARLHQKIRFQRNNWLHQLSRSLVDQYDLICLEDLNIKGMVKGKKTRHLNRAIADQGWYMFVDQLVYKAKLYGKHTFKIGRWDPSSKTCSSCHHKIDKLELDVREWICPKCGATHDRDLNAALNIKFWAMAMVPENTYTPGTGEINAREDTSADYDTSGSQVSLKQEACASLGHK